MPEITPHISLKKPLASEIADISVINENMDTIDSAFGDLSTVPTTAKTAAGAVTELYEAIQDIDVDISDGSITPVKLSFDPATQTELDAHTNATNVHGATNAPTASRLILRDAAGRAKVTAPAARDDIARLDTVTSKFGAESTSGVLDWNDEANTQPGTGPTLLLGSATNGPGGATYFHVFNIEYGTKNGSGQITQYAIPYAQAPALNAGLQYRARYSSVWTPWYRLWGDGQLRINAGRLEFFDGSAWKGVGEPVYKNVKALSIQAAAGVASEWVPVLSISGKKGFLNSAVVQGLGSRHKLRVTIDGVVVYAVFLGTSQIPGGIVPADRFSTQMVNVTGREFPYVNPDTLITAGHGYVYIPSNLYFDNSLLVEKWCDTAFTTYVTEVLCATE